MDVLGIESAAVVGNSMGGFVGAELAIRFPPRVQRLVSSRRRSSGRVPARASRWCGSRGCRDAVAARALARATDDIATRPTAALRRRSPAPASAIRT